MKIVLKVAIVCKKCKSCILQIVSKIEGIKSLTFDDEKSTLTVVGEADVVVVVGALRKAKHMAEVVTVGDEKKEAEEKNKEEEEKEECRELQARCCNACQPYYVTAEDHPNSCTIL